MKFLKQYDLSVTGKMGEFCNHNNWLRIVWIQLTRMSHWPVRLEMYKETPIFIHVDITQESVKSVALKLSGSSGLGDTYSQALQGWLLKFGEDSTRIITSVEIFVEWLDNGSQLWAAYHTFMSGRLIALDKHPGVRPVGVGKTWKRLFDKIVLKVTGPEAIMVCQDDQLCAGLMSGIDGAVCGVQVIWDENLTTEDCVLLIVDANNAFNKINLVGMPWTVRHLWPPGARFVFN